MGFSFPESLFTGAFESHESKAARRCLIGRIAGRRTKIYQAHDHQHAEFIQTVSRYRELAGFFPRVLWVSGGYVAAEWVPGESGERSLQQDRDGTLLAMASVQASLHSHSVEGRDFSSGFDYIDFLRSRLVRYRGEFDFTDNVERIVDRFPAEGRQDRRRLCHPDVTPRNIVRGRRQHGFTCVDNELLYCSSFHLLDLFNTCHSLEDDPGLVQAYLEHYFAQVGHEVVLEGWTPDLAVVWAARLVGSHFQNGRPDRAYRVADAFRAGGMEDHLVLAQIRKRV